MDTSEEENVTGEEERKGEVLILIAPIDRDGRQITARELSDKLDRRMDDIKRGILAGAETMREAITDLRAPDGWKVAQVQTAFGLTLGAEGSVIVSKASAEASFEISFTYERLDSLSDGK